MEGWGYGDDGEVGAGTDAEVAAHEPTLFPSDAVGLAPGGGGYSYTSLVIEAPVAKVLQSSLSFGAQPAGTTSVAQTVTLVNEGPGSLIVSADSVTGSSAFRATADGCRGATLAVGATCSISVAFAPGATGTADATLSIDAGVAHPLSTVALSGTGISGAPALGALSLSPSSFRAASSGPSATAADSTGTFVVYTDSLAATATFTVEQKASGIKSHGKCGAAPKHRKKGARRCTYEKPLGSFTHTDAAGTNALRFTGRVHGHPLAPGTYLLSASAHAAGGTGNTRAVAFKIQR